MCVTGTKRRRSQDDDTSQSGSVPQTPSEADLQRIDESNLTMEQLQEMYGDFATSLTERVKRRRKGDEEDEDYEPPEQTSSSRSRRRDSRRNRDSVEVIEIDEDSRGSSSKTSTANKEPASEKGG